MCWYFQVFCSIFSGALLALSIPNALILWGSPLTALFSLVPFYIALSKTSSYFRAFILAGLQAFVCHLLSSYWLGNFHGFALFTLGASALGTFVFHGLFSLFYYFPYALHSPAKNFLSDPKHVPFAVPCKVLYFCAVYTVWEWCKSNGFLGYPWGTVSMSAYSWPLVTQIAAITGTYGITFLFAFFSSLIGEGLLLISSLPNTIAKKQTASSWFCLSKCLCALAIVTVLYGSFQLLSPRRPYKTLNAVLVQQNLDPWGDTDEQAISISCALSEEKIAEFTSADQKADVVVWSEAVLSKYFPTAENYYTHFPDEQPLIPFIRKTKVPFIIGAPLTIDRPNHKYGNATILFDKNGKYQGSYIKMHLVPFAERIPGVEYEWIRKIIKKIAGFSYGWTQGSKAVIFELPLSTEVLYDAGTSEVISLAEPQKKAVKPTVKIGTPICFDDAFGEVCRRLYLAGSEVFINLTNDAWSQTESAEIQHFVVSHYRAIEYRTTLARSTNAGFTCVVDPCGRVIAHLPLFEQDALAARIPVYERKMTVYARFGDWLIKVLVILIVSFIAVSIQYDKKQSVYPIETSLIRKRGRPRKAASALQ